MVIVVKVKEASAAGSVGGLCVSGCGEFGRYEESKRVNET